MILWWLVTAAALGAALAAWSQARRTARRLEQLSQMYWELKYQHSELRSTLARQAGAISSDARSGDPDRSRGADPPARTPEPPVRGQSFVPLTALKR